jgi:hypothetical protein
MPCKIPGTGIVIRGKILPGIFLRLHIPVKPVSKNLIHVYAFKFWHGKIVANSIRVCADATDIFFISATETRFLFREAIAYLTRKIAIAFLANKRAIAYRPETGFLDKISVTPPKLSSDSRFLFRRERSDRKES